MSKTLLRSCCVALLMLGLWQPRSAAAAPAEPVVSLEWLQAHLKDPDVMILATGDQSEFEAGHIVGAGFLPHHATLGEGHHLIAAAAAADVLSRAGAGDTRRIVLYGDDPMSIGWLYMVLASLGHADQTSLLDGNIKAWRTAGYQVVKGSAAASKGHLTARTPKERVVVDAAWVRDRLNDSSIRLLDVRSDEEWRDGMIPGAQRFRWEDLYADIDTGRLKSAAAMKQLFEHAGVTDGRTAVTYCAVGMREPRPTSPLASRACRPWCTRGPGATGRATRVIQRRPAPPAHTEPSSNSMASHAQSNPEIGGLNIDR